MSISATNHVWKHTTYPAAQSYILLAIADIVNDLNGNLFFLGVPKLAKKTKCSERTVQRALAQFVKDGWLEELTEGTGRGNTTEYQFHFIKGDNLTESERVTPVTVKGDKSGMQRVTKEVSIPLLELNRTQGTQFDEFWEIYPIHNGGQVVALKAFKKALKVTTLEEILDGARRYRDDPNRAREFTAYPATWLNQQRWADPALPPQSLKDGRRSLREAPTIVPPKFDPKEFPQVKLDPEKVAKIRRENGV